MHSFIHSFVPLKVVDRKDDGGRGDGNDDDGNDDASTATTRARRRRRPDSYYASSYNESPMGTFARGTRATRADVGMRGFVPPKQFRWARTRTRTARESGGERVETRTMHGGGCLVEASMGRER